MIKTLVRSESERSRRDRSKKDEWKDEMEDGIIRYKRSLQQCHDCVNASSVNVFKNKIDSFLPR